MKLYSDGTVTVTGGSATVNGVGTAFLDNVVEGACLNVKGFAETYQIAKIVTNTQLILARKVKDLADAVVGNNLEYSIGDEFTPWNGLTCPTRHSHDPIAHVNRTLLAIDKAIGQ
jgi:hypothetical protein